MSRFSSLSRPARAAVLVGVVLVGVIVIAALGEGAIRLRQSLRHGLGAARVESLYQYDPVSQLRIPIPGFKSERINVDLRGFRSPEIVDPKPPGTRRIAFLGASTTFCAEVSSDEATWPALTVEKLSKRWPKTRFDFVNAAVPGYTVESSLKSLMVRVAPLEPNVIVIYHAINDLSVHSREAAQSQGITTKWADQSLSWISEYSLLWYLVEKNLMVLKRQREANRSENKLEGSPQDLAAPFKRDLHTLVRAAQGIAKVVVLPTFTTRLRAEQSPEQRIEAAVTNLYYIPYMTPQSLIDAFAAYNQAIREVAAQTGAVLIDDESRIPGDGVHFVDSVHFTDAGSRLMADRVVGGLYSSGALEVLGLDGAL